MLVQGLVRSFILHVYVLNLELPDFIDIIVAAAGCLDLSPGIVSSLVQILKLL